MDMEQRDGRWCTTIEVTAENQTQLTKRVAAVNRLLAKLDKEKSKARRSNGEGTIYTRSDGMVVGRVELPRGLDGKRQRSKPVYSKDYATVVKKLGELKDSVAKGLTQVDKQMTVETYLLDWIEKVAKPRMRPHAWKSYRSAINTRIIPTIGHVRLGELKTEHVRFMHEKILTMTYVGRDEDGERAEINYSTRSVEEAHTVLSTALNDAVEDIGLHRNVAELVTRPAVLSQSHGALTSDQARSVLLAAMADGDPLVTRWAAGLMLGGRQGELLGLQWDRVDLEHGTLDLSWQLEWLPLKPEADPEDPKRFDVRASFEHIPLWRGAALTRRKPTAARRSLMLPLPEPLAAILQVYKKQCPPNRWGLVWLSRRGVPISDSVDRKGWAAAQKRAKIAEPVDVHAMRGTTATLLMEAGVSEKVIQSILGHASVLTTRGYQRVDLSLSRTALGNLDGLLTLG